MKLQAVLQETLELQKEWTSGNSEAMRRRGALVRHLGPSALTTVLEDFALALQIEKSHVIIEGRDGTGPKSEIPWFRFASGGQSPRATDGWYCVYLFRADGSAVYLSLTCGSTNWNGNSFIPREADELRALASWGNGVASEKLVGLDVASRVSVEPMELRAARTPLGPAYELSSALSIRYNVNEIPSTEVLLADARDFAVLLGGIYEEVQKGEEPGSLSPEAFDATLSASEVAGKSSRAGQGFRVSSAERRAIEKAAMGAAKAFLESDGWKVVDRSASASFDFECRKLEQSLFVEVKGTTSRGNQIVVTRNEVKFHRDKFPHNALVIVSGIRLDANGNANTEHATLRVVKPWFIQEERLQIISYTYNL